ncbi:MAG: alpha/beta hydrolase [Verrucomicrobiota bacterium]|nr:alpha/beta hydrolase [Chthoniobacterales bacterium]MDQ3414535.1 alpha/beta hydrolase [Verrucomicrobiota bacterium]
MRQPLLLFSLFITGVASAFAAPQAESRPTPGEVYATASDGTPLTWIVYTPPGRGPWPAVLVIHGGLFLGGDASEKGPTTCAQDLAAAGYIAFSINFRLAPPGSIPGQRSTGQFPEQYDDVALAVQAARDDSRTTGKVGAVGGSSGATHAVWNSVTGRPGQDRLDVAVAISGAYDFSDFSPDPWLPVFIEIVTNYVGVPSTDTAGLRAASPAWVVRRSVPPLFLVDSADDIMPEVQLDDMVARLNASGVRNYEAMTIAGNSHSFANWPAIKSDALAFLASKLNGGGR